MYKANSQFCRLMGACLSGVLIFVASTGSAQENSDERSQNSAELTIRVTDIQQQQGNLNIAVIRSPEDYERFMSPPKEGQDGPEPSQGVVAPVTSDEVRAVIEDLSPGPCLVLLYHDLNDNGRMDTGFLGIPTEPYASSTGKRGRFGPPSWKKGMFEISVGSNELIISLD